MLKKIRQLFCKHEWKPFTDIYLKGDPAIITKVSRGNKCRICGKKRVEHVDVLEQEG